MRRVTWVARRHEGSITDSRKTSRSGTQRTPATALAALTACVLLLGALAAACGDPNDERPSEPKGDPSIVGTVRSATGVTNGELVGSFLVEDGTGDYEKASVAVTVKTGWFRRSGDGFVTVDRPAGDGLIGKTVEVRFTGPVAESYPVQATADWVIVGD